MGSGAGEVHLAKSCEVLVLKMECLLLISRSSWWCLPPLILAWSNPLLMAMTVCMQLCARTGTAIDADVAPPCALEF